MYFMNRYEIDEAVDRHRAHAVLGPAARLLQTFAREVDDHSDGWPYWRAPVQAAARLMTLLDAGDPATTRADVQRALTPLRAFYTRRGRAAGMRQVFDEPFLSPKSERLSPTTGHSGF